MTAHVPVPGGQDARVDLYDVEYFRELEAAASRTSSPTGRACRRRRRGGAGTADGFGTDVIAADFATLPQAHRLPVRPPPMVEAALKTLMRKRLFPSDIYREDFFDASDKATGGVRSPLLKG